MSEKRSNLKRKLEEDMDDATEMVGASDTPGVSPLPMLALVAAPVDADAMDVDGGEVELDGALPQPQPLVRAVARGSPVPAEAGASKDKPRLRCTKCDYDTIMPSRLARHHMDKHPAPVPATRSVAVNNNNNNNTAKPPAPVPTAPAPAPAPAPVPAPIATAAAPPDAPHLLPIDWVAHRFPTTLRGDLSHALLRSRFEFHIKTTTARINTLYDTMDQLAALQARMAAAGPAPGALLAQLESELGSAQFVLRTTVPGDAWAAAESRAATVARMAALRQQIALLGKKGGSAASLAAQLETATTEWHKARELLHRQQTGQCDVSAILAEMESAAQQLIALDDAIKALAVARNADVGLKRVLDPAFGPDAKARGALAARLEQEHEIHAKATAYLDVRAKHTAAAHALIDAVRLYDAETEALRYA